MSKKITKSGFLAWPEDLRKQLEVKYNERRNTHNSHTMYFMQKSCLVSCLRNNIHSLRPDNKTSSWLPTSPVQKIKSKG